MKRCCKCLRTAERKRTLTAVACKAAFSETEVFAVSIIAPHEDFAQGQVSAFISCIAAWIRRCDSESLIQTILNLDCLLPCSSEITSPDLIGLVIPEAKRHYC